VSAKTMEYWIFIQMVLELGLIVVVAVSLLKIRSWYRNIMTVQAGLPSREEMVKMAELAEVMEERRRHLEELLAHLEQKATTLQKRLPKTGSRTPPPVEAPPPWESGVSLRSQVESLHRQGCSTEEIARRLQLNLAEVKMALDLSRARPR
jgi:ATP/maltotriose-dependent transcriptional regulator MalT